MDSLFSLHTPNTFPHAPPPPSPSPSPPQPQPQPPGIHIATTSSAATTTAASTTTTPPGGSIPSFLVPKLEPLDDFVANQEPQWAPHQQPQQYQQLLLQQQQQQQEHPSFLEGHAEDEEETDLYSDYYRLSHLFRVAFAQSLEQRYGCDMLDPNSPPFGDVQDSTPNLNLGDFNVSGPDSQVRGDLSVPPPNSHQQPGIEAASDAAVSDPNSRAIVPAPQKDPSGMAVAVTPRRSHKLRKELVRVTDLGMKDQLHYRGIVRRTRMVYDSLRVLTSVEEEKRAIAAAAALAAASAAPAPTGEGVEGGSSTGPRVPRRLRGDLRAASLMRERDLWLNRDKRIVGAIPGVYVGDLFLFRMELCVLGLHGQIQAGIDYLPGSMSSNGEPIATSVIVSGGYEDDLDDGEVIVYTGQGGQEKNSSRQASHQKMEGGNLALERSMHYGIEVRVIRGVRYEGSASSSGKIYVYDGLYRIVDCWFDVGKSGFGVFKYKLWRIEGQARMGSAILKDARDIRRSGFDFKPMYCLSVDISNRKENVPVRLFNDIDDNQDPLCYEYLARTTFPQFVFHRTGTATGCDCMDGCGDGCFCCMKNGGEFPYNQQGILVRGKPLIFECGPYCSCPPHCRNRVTQKGLKNRLEVFRSEQTGWGVRSLDLIHAGAFICEFTGVVLTREQAQILTMNGDSSIYPNRFSERWAEWGDLSQVYSNFVRPSYPSVPPLDFSLDVSTMRNVACYMSHSSTPNVMVQYVLYDHNNLMFPHVMLFAMENIPPMRELSLDYGVADEWTGKLSICH